MTYITDTIVGRFAYTSVAIHTFGVVLLAGTVIQTLRSWYRLRHVPGPFLASFSSAWMLRRSLSGRFHEHLREVGDTYGTLVRVGPNDLVASDPETLRRMSAVRSPYTKGTFYETGRITPGEDTIVSLRDEARHKALRSKMGPAFNGRENEGFSFGAGIDSQVCQLVNLIDSKYLSQPGQHRPVQFFEKISFFALDAISDISFGQAFGYLTADKDLYRSTTRLAQTWPLSLMLPRDGDQTGFGRLMGLVDSIIDKRLAPGAEPQKDMMQAFINSGMSRSELTQQVFVQIIAGSISTTTAICMTLLCLLTTPSAYAALIAEIDRATSTTTTTTTTTTANSRESPLDAGSPASIIITNTKARALPYLQAVIREGLRFYPPVIGLGSKQVPPGGDTIKGIYIPEGTQVGMNIFGLMRSRAIWGDDVDVFRPERWIEAEAAVQQGGDDAVARRLQEMNGAVELVFGHGKYVCLGKGVAMMELGKVLFELLARYHFSIINKESPIKASSAIFWAAKDLWLHIGPRRAR
ncbi:cytochrome P450 [Microdochium trichocladiopsis]|uniref:Cytochrome P450 n=1 Tax=Microdochium trichocladiopsis TaxID=1682393 RepID=A0A9P8Y2P7_9PEZI|nr:cytochrome P450 [Microdochium trichocladiopsis]KAH7027769.1 cytochrome P450 [Microdochium trichocladiopsis]